MKSPSSFETLESRPSLDTAQCAAIGRRLTAVRTDRKLTVDDVGRTLLLSPRQVRSLESFELQAFHNVTFYLSALRKYAAFCGLDDGLITRLETTKVEPIEKVERTVLPIEDSRESLRRKGLVSAAIVALIVVAGAVWNLSRTQTFPFGATTAVAKSEPAPSLGTPPTLPAPITELTPASPVPAEPTEPVDSVTSTGSSPVTGSPAPSELTSGEPTIPEPQELAPVLTPATHYGSFRSNQKAWMFLRNSDNSVIERTLAPGEVVQLRAKPRYLALGTGDVDVTIGDVTVDTSKFVRNGTLRMGVAEFTTAEENATATPVSDTPPDTPIR